MKTKKSQDSTCDCVASAIAMCLMQSTCKYTYTDALTQSYHTHAYTTAKLNDQFGFKPTGSTTAALVDITNTISIMLETNKYVRCLLIDFSKAFDSVDHLIILNKLKAFNIADNIIRWVASFLTDRISLSK